MQVDRLELELEQALAEKLCNKKNNF